METLLLEAAFLHFSDGAQQLTFVIIYRCHVMLACTSTSHNPTQSLKNLHTPQGTGCMWAEETKP